MAGKDAKSKSDSAMGSGDSSHNPNWTAQEIESKRIADQMRGQSRAISSAISQGAQ